MYGRSMSLQTLGPGEIEPGLPLSSLATPGFAIVYWRFMLREERWDVGSRLPCLSTEEV